MTATQVIEPSVNENPISTPDAGRASAFTLLGVLLLSASGLIFELTLTRIFSATIWYHYTFVAISVALFGWGLGGFAVYLFGLANKKSARPILVVLSLLPAVLLPAFLVGILYYPLTPDRLNFYFVLSALPFMAGGAALSLAFELYHPDSNRLYFADLIGAAAGVLMVPVVIRWLGAETTVLATAVLPALAGLLLSLPKPGQRAARALPAFSLLVLAGAVALTVWNVQTQTLAIRDAPSKGLYKWLRASPGSAIVSDHWNAYSRITAVRTPSDMNLARLFIDSDAWTNVLHWDGKAESLAKGRDWFRAFPFRLNAAPRVLVIGPGGGTDVALAIAAGSPLVTGVEMNPLMINSVRQFGADAGNLYEHPKLKLVVDEGRNFVERCGEHYDMIVLGFVDSWASVTSGGLSLTENYLYTREALEAYYDHLSEHGALVIIRWPTDVPRLVANATALLSARGMDPATIGQHILAVSQHAADGGDPPETVFMLSKSPLTPVTVNELLAGHDQVHVIYAPGRPSEQVYTDLFSGGITFAKYTDSFPTLATPVADDRPFYFATEKPWGIPGFVAKLLEVPVAAVVGFSILLLAAGRWMGLRVPNGRTIAYFGALGVGFILCEIGLIQRLIMLLGHPIYTLVVILFTILLTGSVGSLLARRIPTERIPRALSWIIPCVIVLMVASAFGLPALVRWALPLSLPARIALAAAAVAPFGLLMGMPFPLGLRRLSASPQGPPVSVLWGINGIASVIGSLAAVVLAVVAGFTTVFLVGACCYLLARVAKPV